MYFFLAPFSCEENGFPELPNIYDVGAENPDPEQHTAEPMEDVRAADPVVTQVATPITGDGTTTDEVADPPPGSGKPDAAAEAIEQPPADGDKTMEEVLAAEPEATQVTPPTGDGATEEVADPPSKSGEMSAMHNCNAAFLYLDIYMAFLTTTERLYFVYLLRCCRSSRALWNGTARYPICDVERLYSREQI